MFGIDKSLQCGAHYDFVYRRLSKLLQHGWAEALIDGKWIVLEGIILDSEYLQAIKKQFREHRGPFNGFAIATEDFQNLKINWTGKDTFIQRSAIVEDRGIFDSPDEFYVGRSTNLRGWRGTAWRFFFHSRTNKRLDALRLGDFPKNPSQYLLPLPVSIFQRN